MEGKDVSQRSEEKGNDGSRSAIAESKPRPRRERAGVDDDRLGITTNIDSTNDSAPKPRRRQATEESNESSGWMTTSKPTTIKNSFEEESIPKTYVYQLKNILSE